ncbi:hypothetical protein ISR94_00175 [Candidatus Microgenomates bacterium]|nr:hypothetical protein [Candidatus Microgenomates bacterium]
MGLTDVEKQDLLESFTGDVLDGNTYEKNPKRKGSFKDKEGSRPPLNLGKEAGQATSKSGFPKGKVF